MSHHQRTGEAAAVRGLVGIGKGIWASTAPRFAVAEGEKDPRTSDMEGTWLTCCWPCFCMCHRQTATGPDQYQATGVCCWLLYVIPIPCPNDLNHQFVRQGNPEEVRSCEERSDKLTTLLLRTETSRTRTSVQDAPTTMS